MRITAMLLALGLLLSFQACNNSKADNAEGEMQTVTPVRMDIVKKTVATGAIEPRREVEIKSQVSGLVSELYVEPGQIVKSGDLLAKIKIIPNTASLASAESGVQKAQITKLEVEKELVRQRDLFDKGIIAEQEFNTYLYEYDIAVQDLQAAQTNLQIIQEGAASNSSQVLNLIRSTIDGMVLDIPVEEGTNVIESNTFNEGTTIAAVADMGDLIFVGNVDESEVGKIREGMPIRLTVGAIEGKVFNATLEYISPKGVDEDGTIQFEIKASVTNSDTSVFLRAGYSANADIVLDERKQVLAINEACLLFEEGGTYVEVANGDGTFEKRQVELGLSDGINIEVVSGLSESDQIKAPSYGGGGGY